VGKNASGKTRLITALDSIMRMIQGTQSLQIGEWGLVFEDDGAATIHYTLTIGARGVIAENFTVNDEQKLQRAENGVGIIYAEQLQQTMTFQVPEHELASRLRRDDIQHPFLKPLHGWAVTSRTLFFADMGKNILTSAEQIRAYKQAYTRLETNTFVQGNDVHSTFEHGKTKLGQQFVTKILQDMQQLRYDIKKIELAPNVRSTAVLSKPYIGLRVTGADNHTAEQLELSQGMYRALAVLIFLNYAQVSIAPACLLIDDIGEGLDFERSTALIALIIQKAQTLKTQVIMTTNDRFVMNGVPLEYWSVIERQGNTSVLYNAENAKQAFEDFETLGLNNFDFFTGTFYKQSLAPNLVHES
jgi:energy-coupling factor transporter ATP-binding protein EcfA2